MNNVLGDGALTPEENSIRPSADSGIPPTCQTIPETVTVALCSCDKLDSVPFPSRRKFSLERFAVTLNGLQSSFRFVAVDAKWNLGIYDKTHIYSNSRYGDKLKDAMHERHCPFAIVITTEDLEDTVFNAHKEDEGWGIITTSRYVDYLPPGSSLFRYLAYLVLCETLCLVGKYQFEHARHAHCLFDMCRNKRDLTQCLSRPSVEQECQDRLRDAGFSDTHLQDVYEILTFVGMSSVPQMLTRGVTEPGASFLLGVAATLATAITVTICVTLAEALFAGVALFWVLWLFVLAGRGRPQRPKDGRAMGAIRQVVLRMSRQ
jgi:hypothetical protein